MEYQNNYAERSSIMSNAAKNFDILATSGLHNYFDGPTKLFSDLYPAKFLNISVKSFLPSDIKITFI